MMGMQEMLIWLRAQAPQLEGVIRASPAAQNI
jgi:hypothetical protein